MRFLIEDRTTGRQPGFRHEVLWFFYAIFLLLNEQKQGLRTTQNFLSTMPPPSRSKISHFSLSVISSLADPLSSPYCSLIVVPVVAFLLPAKLPNALKHRDPNLLDVAVSLIKFFTHTLDDPVQYHDVETRLVPTTLAEGYRCHCLDLLPDFSTDPEVRDLHILHLRPRIAIDMPLRTQEKCVMDSLVKLVEQVCGFTF